jgi:hypothetical protein
MTVKEKSSDWSPDFVTAFLTDRDRKERRRDTACLFPTPQFSCYPSEVEPAAEIAAG